MSDDLSTMVNAITHKHGYYLSIDGDNDNEKIIVYENTDSDEITVTVNRGLSEHNQVINKISITGGLVDYFLVSFPDSGHEIISREAVELISQSISSRISKDIGDMIQEADKSLSQRPFWKKKKVSQRTLSVIVSETENEHVNYLAVVMDRHKSKVTVTQVAEDIDFIGRRLSLTVVGMETRSSR